MGYGKGRSPENWLTNVLKAREELQNLSYSSLRVSAPLRENSLLFSHGVDAAGLPTIEQWREVFKYARKHGDFVGIVEDFPRNFPALIQYNTELQRLIKARYPLPGALSLTELDKFITQAGDRFPVQWLGKKLSSDVDGQLTSSPG